MRSENPILFFSKKEKESIVQAIHEAEKKTSGEIRVHLVKNVKGHVLEHAREIFDRIGMSRTKHRNGILILMVLDSKQFAIVGDQGIHEKVPATFWNDIVSGMAEHFKQNAFSEGLKEAVLRVGSKLSEYFPIEPNDENELSDEISYSLQ